jgi:anti-sigma B factor antagonist
MSLYIEESTREGVLILTLKGQITFGDAHGVHQKISELAAAGHLKIVLDLKEVLYIDSTGLGALVGGYATVQKKNGAVKLVNPNKRNLELLLMTQLHTVFEVFDQLDNAVNSFFPDRQSKRFDFLTLSWKQLF